MSVVKAETFQGAVYLLDDAGRVWRVNIETWALPTIQMVETVRREEIGRLAQPLAERVGGR